VKKKTRSEKAQTFCVHTVVQELETLDLTLFPDEHPRARMVGKPKHVQLIATLYLPAAPGGDGGAPPAPRRLTGAVPPAMPVAEAVVLLAALADLSHALPPIALAEILVDEYEWRC
jgi:hypothetical protein